LDSARRSFSMIRFNAWYGALLLVFAVIVLRLFYIQIIQHGYYAQAALASQLKEYVIPAERGIIEAHDGDTIVPIVLNEDTFTLFADPKFIKNTKTTAQKVATILGGNADDYEKQLKQPTRYAVLAKKLNKSQKDQIEKLDIKGLGLRTEPMRTYPQGSLAAQLLGFVNDDGQGKYGIEQFLDTDLKGKPGELKAITDASGVPLVANQDNVRREPEAGKQVIMTIDIGMQKKVEDTLKTYLPTVNSASGSVIVMDPNTGAIKAMANYPTYNPAEFYNVSDASVFNNAAASSPLEVGSIMKTLTIAAGLNEKVIAPSTTFYDPGAYTLDGNTVKDVEEDGGAGTRSVPDILRQSLNTGATWTLMQLGGGEVNEKARVTWHNYLVDHYQLGKKTGLEQGYEAAGSIPDPTKGYGLNIQYANTTFGQGILITPLQMASAFSAVINGGTYYKPHLIDGAPQIVSKDVVSSETSTEMRAMLENDVNNAYTKLKKPGYKIGGKTGTAQISNPAGGYYTDKVNGTFIGYVGGDQPQYVIMVRVNEPKVSYYAGIAAASPLFDAVSGMLINNFSISPASQ
jgi:cell division protein FtsI/penicillin-binding protein 2